MRNGICVMRGMPMVGRITHNALPITKMPVILGRLSNVNFF